MANGAKWAQRIQLGRESTAGTGVAATTIWRGVGGNIQDDREIVPVDEMIGVALPTTRAYVGRYGTKLAMAATPATFEQLPHILEAGIKSVGTGASDGSGSGKIYAYPVGMTSANTLKTYTIETGDNEQASEMPYSFVEKFTLTGERHRAVMVSADWIGRSWSSTSFTGSLTAPTVEEILAPRSTFYIDAVSGTIGTTVITGTLLKWELSVTTGWRPKYTLDMEGGGTQGGRNFAFIYFDRDSFNAEFSATYEHNTAAVGQKALFDDATPRLFRISIPGSSLGTAGTTYSVKTFVLDMAAYYTEWSALDADEGNSIVNVKARIGYNPTAAKALSITVVNELSSIP